MRCAAVTLSMVGLVFMLGCGGSSTSDSSSGGAGGSAGAGASGGTAGAGGVGGTGASGGSGGSSGSGGSAGSANECSAELRQQASLSGPPIGFDGSSTGPGSAVVAAAHADGLELTLGPGGGILKFRWVGPDLSSRFAVGEMVQIGNQQGWDFVAGDAHTAAAWREYGFVAPVEIPDVPYYGPKLSLAPQCTFLEGGGGCGQPPGTVTVLAVEATTGAAPVLIRHGDSGELVGWSITNVNNVQYPGYSSEDCVVEAGFAGTITALGPALDDA